MNLMYFQYLDKSLEKDTRTERRGTKFSLVHIFERKALEISNK